MTKLRIWLSFAGYQPKWVKKLTTKFDNKIGGNTGRRRGPTTRGRSPGRRRGPAPSSGPFTHRVRSLGRARGVLGLNAKFMRTRCFRLPTGCAPVARTRCFRLKCKIVTLTFFFRGFERIFFTRSLLDKAHRVTFGHFFCSHQKCQKVTLCALSTFSFLAFFLGFF